MVLDSSKTIEKFIPQIFCKRFRRDLEESQLTLPAFPSPLPELSFNCPGKLLKNRLAKFINQKTAGKYGICEVFQLNCVHNRRSRWTFSCEPHVCFGSVCVYKFRVVAASWPSSCERASNLESWSWRIRWIIISGKFNTPEWPGRLVGDRHLRWDSLIRERKSSAVDMIPGRRIHTIAQRVYQRPCKANAVTVSLSPALTRQECSCLPANNNLLKWPTVAIKRRIDHRTSPVTIQGANKRKPTRESNQVRTALLPSTIERPSINRTIMSK